MRTRRVAISMTNSTYSGLRKIVSTVKKSHASRPRIERRSAVSGHRLYTAYRLIALRGLCVTVGARHSS